MDEPLTVIPIEAASLERVPLSVWSRVDPTGTAPEFVVTVSTATSPSGTWVAGTWDGAWDSATGRVEALSPTIGAAGALAITEAGRYILWVRWTIAPEQPVKRAAFIKAT